MNSKTMISLDKDETRLVIEGLAKMANSYKEIIDRINEDEWSIYAKKMYRKACNLHDVLEQEFKEAVKRGDYT